MKFKLDIKSICVYSVIILLTIALSVSFFVIGNKNKAIEENKSQITEITKQLDDAKNQIAEKDKANGELSQKLQQAETEKNNLQKENNNVRISFKSFAGTRGRKHPHYSRSGCRIREPSNALQHRQGQQCNGTPRRKSLCSGKSSIPAYAHRLKMEVPRND